MLFPPGACARFIHDVRLGAEHENMFGHCGHTRASVPHAAHGGRFPGFKAGLASMPVQSLRLNKSLYYTTEHNTGVLEAVRANPMQSARHITELAEETSQQSLVIVVSPIWTTHVLQNVPPRSWMHPQATPLTFTGPLLDALANGPRSKRSLPPCQRGRRRAGSSPQEIMCRARPRIAPHTCLSIRRRRASSSALSCRSCTSGSANALPWGSPE